VYRPKEPCIRRGSRFAAAKLTSARCQITLDTSLDLSLNIGAYLPESVPYGLYLSQSHGSEKPNVCGSICPLYYLRVLRVCFVRQYNLTLPSPTGVFRGAWCAIRASRVHFEKKYPLIN